MRGWRVYRIKQLRQAIVNQLIDMSVDISWMGADEVDVAKMRDITYFNLVYALVMRIKGSLLEQSAEKEIANYVKVLSLRD
jgi:hypothetical protein